MATINHEAFYKITYGLYVVSSANGSERSGYVANTVFQVTSQPARFAIACNKDNFTCGLISRSGVFAFSVLHQDARAELIGLFGYKSGRGLNKFASVRHRTGQTGAPILLEDSLAWFECKVVQTIDAGTHLLFIGEMVDGDVIDGSQPPLTYAYYRDVKKGKAPKNAPTYLAPSGSEPDGNTPPSSGKYVCPVCGYVYDPAVGDPDAGIPAGTRFEDLPASWVCPVCSAGKPDFVKQS
jgi:flavin reductase (DIM6/NTAB) family NADH-FMN oxidoreductase RutF/rubredoxin